MYGCKTWSMTKKDKVMLHVWERKVLSKVNGPATEKGNED
jgi:hypothetical protein